MLHRLALIACTFAMTVLSASAQEQGIWTHPSGAYTLDYGTIDWRTGDSFSYGGREASVTFEPQRSRRNGAQCLIFEIPVDRLPAGADQEQANRAIERYNAQNWATALDFEPGNVRAFANEVIDGGVRVASLVVDDPTPPALRSYYRTFILATPAGAVGHEISCSHRPNADAAAVAQIENLIASLRFVSPLPAQ
jgi:hypothetical protein